jgi:hypothetical protein
VNRPNLEEKAEKALLFLHEMAPEHAQLRAEHDYMQAWIKSEKARIKTEFTGLSNAAAEDEALKSEAYLKAIAAAKEASVKWYRAQFLREAARAHLDAFQTVSANERTNA